MQAAGRQSAARAGAGFVFFHRGQNSKGGPKCLARGLAGAGQVPGDPEGLCPDVLEETAIWRQREGEGAVPVFLGRQAQP